MCGRYNIITDAEAILDAYQIIGDLIDEIDAELRLPRFTVFPNQSLPIVHRGQLKAARWWLVPHWAKEIQTKRAMFNARSDRITESAWAYPFKKNRCLIPATGWYDKKGKGKPKDSPEFMFETGGLITFAGIAAYNKELDVLSFAIVTTEPSAFVSEVHDRMPVILSENQFEMWLNEDTPEDDLLSVLVPYQGNDLTCRVVSPKVRNWRNDYPGVMDDFDA